MTERDPKVTSRYRELGAEEPPRALDEAILAASRRSVQKRSWNRPIAIAAVIVLAVAVTVHVQREQPAEDLVTAARVPAPEAPAPQAAQEATQPERPAVAATAPQFTPDPKPHAAPEPSPPVLADSRARRSAPAPVEERAAAAPPPSVAADQLMMKRGEAQRDAVAGARESARAEAAAPAPQAAPAPAARAMAAMRADAISSLARTSPEQWLLAIDDLKRQGKHEEAERELAEFRTRYPDYRIPEAITEKFERR